MSELAIASRFIGEAGIFGMGWVLFFWAMLMLRIERKRYQELAVHTIEWLTKSQMNQRIEDDVDAVRKLFGKQDRQDNEPRN